MIKFEQRFAGVTAFRSTRTGRKFPFAAGEFAEFAERIKRGEYDDLIAADAPVVPGRSES